MCVCILSLCVFLSSNATAVVETGPSKPLRPYGFMFSKVEMFVWSPQNLIYLQSLKLLFIVSPLQSSTLYSLHRS